MAENKVYIKVVEIKGSGQCPLGLVKDQSWVVASAETPKGFCGWAYNSIFPFVQVLRFGGNFPWEKKGQAIVCCPDPNNTVVFKLKVQED